MIVRILERGKRIASAPGDGQLLVGGWPPSGGAWKMVSQGPGCLLTGRRRWIRSLGAGGGLVLCRAEGYTALQEDAMAGGGASRGACP